MSNHLCHFEIGCRDSQKAGKFYSGLFDWELEQKGNELMLRTGADVGGHIGSPGHEGRNYTIFYVMVDDVAASVKKAIALGGKEVTPPTTIPGGEYAWIADPEGNTIGIYRHK